MSIWRDVDSDMARVGLIVRRHGLTIYLGRRVYLAYWGKP